MEYLLEVVVGCFDVWICSIVHFVDERTGDDDGVGSCIMSGVETLFVIMEVALEVVYVVVASNSSYVEIFAEDLF